MIQDRRLMLGDKIPEQHQPSPHTAVGILSQIQNPPLDKPLQAHLTYPPY
ncbi:hypothetical protein HanIR_Chr03g0134491 [Helianthus annuus]|nr:hypothetical protein HanIR_Chr03g0134491 [Helianthus annuus]